MSVIGAATRVAATYYWRCRFKAEIEFVTQRILFREVSKSSNVKTPHRLLVLVTPLPIAPSLPALAVHAP